MCQGVGNTSKRSLRIMHLPTGAIVDVFPVLWELALATLIFCVEFKTRIVSPFCSSSIPIPPPDTCISIINHVPSALQDGLLQYYRYLRHINQIVITICIHTFQYSLDKLFIQVWPIMAPVHLFYPPMLQVSQLHFEFLINNNKKEDKVCSCCMPYLPKLNID